MSSVTEPKPDGADTTAPAVQPYTLDVAAVVAELSSDANAGLTSGEATARLARYGPNEISKEEPPSLWAVAVQQLRDPMNIMLIAVVAVSFVIGQVSTGVIVGAAHPPQRRPRHAPGAEGAGEHRRACQPAGAAGEGRARRLGDARAGRRRRARRHRRGRGGRHRPGRRTHRPLGDARDAGGSADRGERARRKGRGDAGGARRGARRPLEHAVPEHVGDERHGRAGGDRRPAWRPRWERSRRC